jgi:stage V sporulation protein G
VFSDFRFNLVNKDCLRAFVSCKVGGAIVLDGMRVVEGTRGRFVSMPSRKDAKGEYQDIYFPASKEVREELQEAVLEGYSEALRTQSQPAAHPSF